MIIANFPVTGPAERAEKLVIQSKSEYDLSHLSTRYLSVYDCQKSDRDEFVQNIFPDLATRTFSDGETFFLSRAETDYDVLVIGGNDTARVCRFLGANLSLLNSVIKIAVVKGSSPQRRARLLSHGFDEVIDCNRASVEEAKARISNIAERVAQCRSKDLALRIRRTAVSDICHPTELTPRELAVLQVLVPFEGQSVSVNYLSHAIDPLHSAKFKRSIKVIISNMRKKISADYKIEADQRGGYRLYKPDTSALNA